MLNDEINETVKEIKNGESNGDSLRIMQPKFLKVLKFLWFLCKLITSPVIYNNIYVSNNILHKYCIPTNRNLMYFEQKFYISKGRLHTKNWYDQTLLHWNSVSPNRNILPLKISTPLWRQRVFKFNI